MSELFISSVLRGSHSQNWQDSRVICSNLAKQVTIMSPQLRHVTNIYGIISTFLTPIISRLNMMVNHHTLVLPGRIDVVTTTRSRY